jgi:pimeloyl-ACP methyl ester carboxylesterase
MGRESHIGIGPAASIRCRRLGDWRRAAALTIMTVAITPRLSACCDVCHLDPTSHAFEVDVERGARRTTVGDRVRYSLFTPEPNDTLPAPPYPGIVISHGFARSGRFHRDTACALAERGIVVLTPDRAGSFGGRDAEQRQIDNLIDHVRWLRSRAADVDDSLFGLLDPGRVGLVGHSAGGAISFEAAIDLADAGEAVQAVMLLDGVPWARTLERAGELHNVAFGSARSAPAPCNAQGQILDLLDGLSFSTVEILVAGGTHCDPENPTDWLCRLLCDGSDEQARAVYQKLLYAFLFDALDVPDVGVFVGFAAVVEQLEAEGRIDTTRIGGTSRSVPN